MAVLSELRQDAQESSTWLLITRRQGENQEKVAQFGCLLKHGNRTRDGRADRTDPLIRNQRIETPQRGSAQIRSFEADVVSDCSMFLPFTSMLNLRIAFRKCVRRASILGHSPLRHHTSRSSNVIHISRLSYSNGNIEEAGASMSAQKDREKQNAITITIPIDFIKSLLDMVNYSQDANRTISNTAAMPPQGIANEPKAVKISSIAESKALDPTKSSNKLDFRRYHIWACGFSENVTEDMLREFYSRFGEVIRCKINYNEQGNSRGAVVVFSSNKAMHRALESSPHRIRGEKVIAKIGGRVTELSLRVLDLSLETTEESLRAFYSRFGNLTKCLVKNDPERGQTLTGYVTFASQSEVNCAMSSRPHIIHRKLLRTERADQSGTFTVFVGYLPESATPSSLFKVFSKFGKIVYLQVLEPAAHDLDRIGFVSYGTQQEADNALNNGPHMVEGASVKVELRIEKIRDRIPLLS
ncbi:RNA recognition motif domain-containing protein [Ditylenchus destructor]|uniref:RNA recognition motif domain-containing protein n=1 Tax=Ditylenchus destructor TaxID=166010 RepID=A0AAD4MSN5_9BILA|nr:RNA recognition motif domain-containing protein [Ditylenchus destructor]